MTLISGGSLIWSKLSSCIYVSMDIGRYNNLAWKNSGVFLHVYTGVYVCIHVQMCACVCMRVEARGQPWGTFLQDHPPFEIGSLTGLESTCLCLFKF